MLQSLIGLGVIIKDEIDLVEDFHNHVKDKFKEINYVDGFSGDGTFEILSNFNDLKECLLFQREMDFDFGKQRNYLLASMKSPWVLMLDADERMNPGLQNFVNAFQEKEADAYEIMRAEFIDNTLLGVSRQIRLFKNVPEFKFAPRIHERLTGYNKLEQTDLWSIILHDKTTERQGKQNKFYWENYEEQRQGA